MNARRLCVSTTTAWSILLVGGMLLGALAFLARPAEAAPIHYVDDDAASDTGDCSTLATACQTIGYALTQAVAGEVIEIAAGEYTEPGLTIDKDVTLSGAGFASTFIQADTTAGTASDRVIEIVAPATNVTIQGVTVRHGVVAAGQYGGGILNEGDLLTLQNVTVTLNEGGFGGGVANGILNSLTVIDSFVDNNAANTGGGIFSWSNLTLQGSFVQTNTTTTSNGGGLAAGGISLIQDSTIAGNASGTDGGGVAVLGTGGHATIEDTLIINNTANNYGGGIFVTDFVMPGDSNSLTLTNANVRLNTANNRGGGIYIGVPSDPSGTNTLSLTGSAVNENQADEAGGIWNGGQATVNDGSINQNYATTGTGGAIFNDTAGQLELTDLTVVGNTSTTAGGGLDNLGTAIVTGGVFNQNLATAGNGGGIYNRSTGTVTFNDTNVTVNDVSPIYHGGGIYNDGGTVRVLSDSVVSGNVAQSGAGIANRAGGTVEVSDSSVSLNIGINNGLGGGIFNADAGSTVTITNSTLDGNKSDGAGGGIYNMASAEVTVSNSSISDNEAITSGGGIAAGGGTVTAHDVTIIGNNAVAGGGIYVGAAAVVVDDASYFQGNSVLPGGTGAVAYNTGGALRIEESAIGFNDYPVGGGAIYNAAGATTVWLNWWGASDGPGGDGPGTGETVVSVGGALTFAPWLTSVELDATPSTGSAGDSIDVTAAIANSDGLSAGVSPMVASFSHSEATPPEDVTFPLPTPSEATHSFTLAGTPDTVTASILFRGLPVGLVGQVVVDEPPPPGDIETDDDETPTLTEDGESIAIDPACYEEATVPDSGAVTLATSGDCLRVRVTAPEGSLPAGHRLVLGIPEDLDTIPDGAFVGFIVQLQTADGDVVADALDLPVQVQVRVDRSLLPASNQVALAFWDGSEWVELLAEVDASGDGPVVLTAEVDHFTIFGVVSSASCALTPEPADSGVSLARASGCAIEDLPTAASYWATVDGRFVGYNPAAPDFVNATFFALYPDGIIADGTVFIVVR